MEQKSEITGIARPKAQRFRSFNAFSAQQCCGCEIAGRRDTENSVCSFLGSVGHQPDAFEQRQAVSACAYSLETLAGLEEDEDRNLRERAETEAELRLRLDVPNLVHLEETGNCSGRRRGGAKALLSHSWPRMNNALLAPERPSNPMVRDTAFAAGKCRNKADEEVAVGLSHNV